MRREMVGVIVVTHCRLAEEMICAARLVVGEELRQFQPVSIDPKEGSEEIREKIISALRKVDVGQGVLILTDMYGGTPSNISLSFLRREEDRSDHRSQPSDVAKASDLSGQYGP